MKEFITDFLKILASAITIICFAFMSFLLIINIYHYKEVTYTVNSSLANNVDYTNYKNTLADVDKKMKSVKYNISSPAKPIFEYYSNCMSAINDGVFNKFGEKTKLSSKDIYDANDEMISVFNNKCLFYISNNISMVTKNAKSFDSTKKLIDEKTSIIIDNADYLRKSQLGNTAYSFFTDNTRISIFNRVNNEIKLTVDNYNLMASVLNDVSNWYVAEYGGNG